MLRFRLIPVAAALLWVLPCRAESNVGFAVLDLEHGENPIVVAVWYPTDADPKPHTYGGSTQGRVSVDAEPRAEGGPFPLLVFSHGYGGSGLGAVFLFEALAARGWIVAAPDHSDRHSAVRIRTGQQADFDRIGFLRHAREISESGPEDREAYLYRIEEMESTLAGVLASERFGKRIDPERIAVGGHSFGGYTALGVCGALPGRRDKRVQATLLFSTGAAGYLYRDAELAAVDMPSMYLLGELEKEDRRGEKTMTEIAERVHGLLPAPKYFLEVKGANHFSFNNRFSDTPGARRMSGTAEQFDVIRRYSIAFLEKHVLGSREADAVLDAPDPLLTRSERTR
ncbi:MAG: hypothetical protein HY720_11830 [Planctomycetes bacterium]|nr:hypothetical protein [Planctomycetota bacterium]